MSWLLLILVFLAGVWCGIPLGSWGTLGEYGPILHRMRKRILELEEAQVARELSDDQARQIEQITEVEQIQILEQWIRK